MKPSDRMVEGEGTVNHFLSICFADELKKSQLGLKYISQMRDEYPYWYIWFTDLPGVFKLIMLDCSSLDDCWDWHALFRVKYYPHPQEKAFQGLSVLEQICRMSEMFDARPAQWEDGETGCVCHGGVHHHAKRFADLQDGTGVPNISRAAEIPNDFFLAGQMELFHRDGYGSEVVWESQDSWQVKLTENYYITDADGAKLKVLRKGDVDRDFPGWILTDFISRRFSAGWQAHFGYDRVEECSEDTDGVVFSSDGQSLNAMGSSAIRRRLQCCRMQH
jgi:hypothetical protein